MKKLLLAAAIMFASASASHAACTKASLNGVWYAELAPGLALQVTIFNGRFMMPTSGDIVTISTFGSTCKGAGTYNDISVPATYPARFAAEAGAGGISAAPNLLMMSYNPSGTTWVSLPLSRQ